jgi:hypothetical protein
MTDPSTVTQLAIYVLILGAAVGWLIAALRP